MKDSKELTEKLAEKRIAEERMQDVRLLLDHLSRSQETTIKLIMDCLYDVGAVNLINQRIQSRPLNRLSKSVASISKPVFRLIAYQWFKKNGPALITRWLTKKVAFAPKSLITHPLTKVENLPSQSGNSPSRPVDVLPPELQPAQPSSLQEVKRLRAQVRMLTGMLVGSIAIFGGAALWLYYGSSMEVLRLRDAEVETQSGSIERAIAPPELNSPQR